MSNTLRTARKVQRVRNTTSPRGRITVRIAESSTQTSVSVPATSAATRPISDMAAEDTATEPSVLEGPATHFRVAGPSRTLETTAVPGDHLPLTDALLEADTYAGDPHVVFAELRAKGPLAWNATKGFWAVSHHAEV